MELMVEYGMSPISVLASATSINARAFHLDNQVGFIRSGMIADLMVVNGNPTVSISDIQEKLCLL